MNTKEFLIEIIVDLLMFVLIVKLFIELGGGK